MLRKLKLPVFLLTVIFVNTGAAIQVGGGHTYSTHSYEQTQPAPAPPEEVLPVIIHYPVAEIPSGKDFIITANVKEIGMGTPIIHYRFGNSKKYMTNVLKPKSPGNYEFKILAAALTDKKIEYYIEVITGSRILATYRSAENPVVVSIKSSGGGNSLLIVGLLLGLAIVGVKVASAVKSNDPNHHRPEITVKKASGKPSKRDQSVKALRK